MSKYNQSVVYAVIQNLGYEPDMGDEARARYEQKIEHMSPAEVWECWCNWNGFINWGHQLHLAHESIFSEAKEVALALGDAYDIGQSATPTSAIGRYRTWKART